MKIVSTARKGREGNKQHVTRHRRKRSVAFSSESLGELCPAEMLTEELISGYKFSDILPGIIV